MQPVLTPLPEFDADRHQDITTPVVWPLRVRAVKVSGKPVMSLNKDGPAGDCLALG